MIALPFWREGDFFLYNNGQMYSQGAYRVRKAA